MRFRATEECGKTTLNTLWVTQMETENVQQREHLAR